MPVGGAAIGAGALLLWLASKAKGTTQQLRPPVCPAGTVLNASGQCAPGQQVVPSQPAGGGGGSMDPGKLIGAGVSLVGAAVPAILSAVGGGAATTGAGAVTTTAASTGATTSTVLSTSLVTGAGIGGFVVAAVVVIAVVTYEIEHAIMRFNQSVSNFVLDLPRFDAKSFFNNFVAQFQKKTGNPNALRLNLTPESIRDIILAALYLEYVSAKAANTALYKFYTWAGWDEQRMSNVCLQQGFPCRQVLAAPNFDAVWLSKATARLKQISAPLWLKPLDSTTGGQVAAQQGQNIVDQDITSLGQLSTAAVNILGTNFQPFVNQAEFIGKAGALAWASVQGYGNVGTAFGPNVQTFSETLSNVMVGWPVYWMDRKTLSGVTLPAYWALDQSTGNAFDIFGVRNFQINVSPRFVQENKAPTALSGFGGFSGTRGWRLGGTREWGRRFGSYGITPEEAVAQCNPFERDDCCMDMSTGAYVRCPDSAGAALNLRRRTLTSKAESVLPGYTEPMPVRSSSFPLLAAGGIAAAFLLLRKKA